MKFFSFKIFKKRRLRIDILTAFSILIGFTVTSEILYSSYANKKLILDFEKKYFSKSISQTAANWLNEYFNQIEIIIDILGKNFVPEEGIGNFDKYNILFLESLKSIPYTLSFYLSFKDGTYFQARILEGITSYQDSSKGELPRYAKFALRSMWNDPDTSVLREGWVYLNEDYGVISKEKLDVAKYNTTKRDWYAKAEVQKSKVWSDVYLFKTTKTAGITLSMPLGYYSDGTALGVIGIDFAVNQFKSLLEKIKVSKNSSSYLINEKNEIIAASSDIETFFVNNETNELSLVTVSTLKDKALETAARKLLRTNENHTSYSVGNEWYVANIQRLEGLPFFLLTISPQSDFTGSFSTVQQDMFLISIFIVHYCCSFPITEDIKPY